MNILETRYRCTDEKCKYDRSIETKFEGGNTWDKDYIAVTHGLAHEDDKKFKTHAKKKHVIETTHKIYPVTKSEKK